MGRNSEDEMIAAQQHLNQVTEKGLGGRSQACRLIVVKTLQLPQPRSVGKLTHPLWVGGAVAKERQGEKSIEQLPGENRWVWASGYYSYEHWGSKSARDYSVRSNSVGKASHLYGIVVEMREPTEYSNEKSNESSARTAACLTASTASSG
jgi:hypothetical protein